MKIETNISKQERYHDTIQYLPIERQVYDFFAEKFPKVSHTFQNGCIAFQLDTATIGVEVGKKTVKLSLHPKYDPDQVRFGGHTDKYPSVALRFNTDLTKQIDEFIATIKKVQDLEKRAAALPELPDRDKIKEFLNQELGTEEVEVSYWNENILDDTNIWFYIHPKGKPPADGIIVHFDGSKLLPAGNIEDALGRPDPWRPKQPTLDEMKTKIVAVEKLAAKVNAFDPNKSSEFSRLLAIKSQADALVKEFKGLS